MKNVKSNVYIFYALLRVNPHLRGSLPFDYGQQKYTSHLILNANLNFCFFGLFLRRAFHACRQILTVAPSHRTALLALFSLISRFFNWIVLTMGKANT